MFESLSHGYDPDFIAGFGMDNHDDLVLQQPQDHEALFPVIKTPIFDGVSNPGEHYRGIDEIEPVFDKIAFPHFLVVNDVHRSHCAYFYAYKQAAV